MATNGVANGAPKKQLGLDQKFTDQVKNSVGPNCEPRFKQLFTGLVQHLHDYVRENEVTMEEFMMGIDLMPKCVTKFDYKDPTGLMGPDANQAGKIFSNGGPNESQIVMDIFGLESLCDHITQKKIAEQTGSHPTDSAVLGPFWRPEAPRYPMDASIVQKEMGGGDRTYLYGRVLDAATGEPIEGAEVDVWHTAPNGFYEEQDPDQPEMNLRGRFTTGKDGKYSFYCLRPVSYPVPDVGPAGDMLRKLDRHFMRPAHIHFILTAPGHKPIITQIYDRLDKYVENDVIFAVKDSLIVDFKPIDGNAKAEFEVEYDFKLAPIDT